MSEKYQAKRSDSVVTPEVRWAYPYLHEKSSKRPNGQPRKTPIWIVTGLFPKLNPDPAQCANYQFLYALIAQACSREPQWGGVFPQGGKLSIQDGDAPPKPKLGAPGQPAVAVDPNKGAWRRGHWLIEASTSLDPGPRVAIMQNGVMSDLPARMIAGRQMYKGGDFGFGSIHAFTYWNENYGVNFGLEGLLWTREGEPIGSSGPKSAAQMFGAIAPVQSPGIVPASPVAPAMPQPYAPNALQAPAAPQPAFVAPVPSPAYAPSPAVAAPPAPPVPGAVGLPPFPGR